MAGQRQSVQQNRAVTTSRTGGQASTFTLLAVAAAVGGWFYWRKRTAEREEGKQAKGSKSAGGRSRFRFPGAKSSTSNSSATRQQQGTGPAFKFPAAAAAAAKAGGARKGNPKKQNKKQRRAEKEAKKEAKGKGLELLHNAGIQTKEDEGPVTVKYVDLTKTAEVYDRVREYQETGKKRY